MGGSRFLAPTVPGGLLSGAGAILTASESLILQAIQNGTYFNAEVPTGAINGTNQAYTLSRTPNPTTSVEFFYNGQLQKQGVGADYTLSGKIMTFLIITPSGSDTVFAIYLSSPV